ncbi:copper resistance CopC family protein [Microbulbifer sediminum]|uniref:copper resistance CopC family protein n=1 Tax=Microbulbifer sediminum TaxID=2904250 RepID=UPI001F3A65C9|nr:copper resistance CopC family protein [Microbulbifer sediminum]
MLKLSLVRFLAMAGFIFSTTLAAHTGLQGSSPADGDQLSQPPASLQLNFSGEVRLMRVSLEEAKQGEVKLEFMPTAVAEKNISLPLPALADGEYTVSWMAMGGDGHKMSGQFSFEITTEN